MTLIRRARRLHRRYTEATFWRRLKKTGRSIERDNPLDPQLTDRLWQRLAAEGLVDMHRPMPVDSPGLAPKAASSRQPTMRLKPARAKATSGAPGSPRHDDRARSGTARERVFRPSMAKPGPGRVGWANLSWRRGFGVVGIVVVVSLGAVVEVRTDWSWPGRSVTGRPAGAPPCHDPVVVSLRVPPELESQVRSAIEALRARTDPRSKGCFWFDLSNATGSSVARLVNSGSDSQPDLWIPDSSAWLDVAANHDSTLRVVTPSLASSPMVLVGRPAALTASNSSSWLSLLRASEINLLLDSMQSTSGINTLLALRAEQPKTAASEAAVTNAIVSLALQGKATSGPAISTDEALNQAGSAGSKLVVPVTEQSFVAYQQSHPNSSLKAIVPRTGSLASDYSLVLNTKSDIDNLDDAADALAKAMESAEVSQALAVAGFRTASFAPLADGRGVGQVNRLVMPSPYVVEQTLKQWTEHRQNLLVVLDISGSMAERIGTQTRMALTTQAVEAALERISNTAHVGLWSFSTKIGMDGADYTELAPVSQLTGAHRAQILAQLGRQRATPDGGTGLYDTAIAAYRSVKEVYDPDAINSVLLFTDGKNDDLGSPTINQTVQTLEGLNNPSNPVRITTIGIGPEVNGTELDKLATATGGNSYVVRDANDLQTVITAALGYR